MSEKKLGYEQYQAMYESFMNYETTLHEANQKRIRIGLKVNIFLPLVFLVASFLVSGAKLFFLILWIGSLFGIAFYLIYVEYTDYMLQKKLEEFGVQVDRDEADQVLLGQEIIERANVATERLDIIDERVEDLKEHAMKQISERLEDIFEKEDDEE